MICPYIHTYIHIRYAVVGRVPDDEENSLSTISPAEEEEEEEDMEETPPPTMMQVTSECASSVPPTFDGLYEGRDFAILADRGNVFDTIVGAAARLQFETTENDPYLVIKYQTTDMNETSWRPGEAGVETKSEACIWAPSGECSFSCVESSIFFKWRSGGVVCGVLQLLGWLDCKRWRRMRMGRRVMK